MIDTNTVPVELRQALAAALGCDPAGEPVEAVLGALAEYDAQLDQRAEKLVDQTMLQELAVRDGVPTVTVIPAPELAAIMFDSFREMLGDAPNYTETILEPSGVAMVVGAAGERERFALTLQRVGRITPHQARQAAEQRAERAEAENKELRAEVNTLKAPPDFHNIGHMVRLGEVFTETIRQLGGDPPAAAQQLMLYARSAVNACERETARYADLAEAAFTAAEEAGTVEDTS